MELVLALVWSSTRRAPSGLSLWYVRGFFLFLFPQYTWPLFKFSVLYIHWYRKRFLPRRKTFWVASWKHGISSLTYHHCLLAAQNTYWFHFGMFFNGNICSLNGTVAFISSATTFYFIHVPYHKSWSKGQISSSMGCELKRMFLTVQSVI